MISSNGLDFYLQHTFPQTPFIQSPSCQKGEVILKLSFPFFLKNYPQVLSGEHHWTFLVGSFPFHLLRSPLLTGISQLPSCFPSLPFSQPTAHSAQSSQSHPILVSSLPCLSVPTSPIAFRIKLLFFLFRFHSLLPHFPVLQLFPPPRMLFPQNYAGSSITISDKPSLVTLSKVTPFPAAPFLCYITTILLYLFYYVLFHCTYCNPKYFIPSSFTFL